ncbi:diacylglycerol kinase family protein [uncultured Streptomyces sp.]|uniref:diacylglycerol kinase family protein n=1 Tax=uncultured Streptomyces sp. TaxID=174707 RepID=UPI00261CD765|nr:diacylglycerol kinase family protein [uncultured Streptomyces sp.]
MPTDTPERRATQADRAVPGPRAPYSGEGTAPSRRPGRAPALTTGAARAAGLIAAMAVCQAALMVGIGLLITRPGAHFWPLTTEDDINTGFERIRTQTWNQVSFVASEAGNTLTIVLITFVTCLLLIVVPRLPRWREAVFLAVGVSLQSLIFLVITEAVDRTRPDVERLDDSPPTSSYTSGHTGAATALYTGLAVLVLARMKGPWRKAVAFLLFLLPLVVGVARLYRGMHHPTDVVGGMLNGGLSMFVVGRALLSGAHVPAPRPAAALDVALAAAESGSDQVPGRTVVVFNPTVTDDATRDALRLVLERHGHHGAEFVSTTAEDPGGGQTGDAVRDGAALVVVCGGDGTVRAASDALAGTGVPLAVVPCGTGNLLARNLGLPIKPADALDAALRGTPHRIDLGRIEGDGLPPAHFAAMAGAGLDAAMLDGTSDRAKAGLGWPAYVLAGVRELRGPRTSLTLRLDDRPALRRSARMVLIANTGTIQGGAAVVPTARPDDGLLDLMILDPHGPGGWMRAATTLLRRRPAAPARPAGDTRPGPSSPRGAVEYFTFRRAHIDFGTEQPRELDGDTVAPGRLIAAEVVPGALTVLLPAREA